MKHNWPLVFGIFWCGVTLAVALLALSLTIWGN